MSACGPLLSISRPMSLCWADGRTAPALATPAGNRFHAVAPPGPRRLPWLTMEGVLICRNADGETVAEVDLDETDLTLPEILDAARAADAALVWAYAHHRPSPEFTETSGYTLLRAETLAHTHDPLPQIDPQLYGPLLAEAYRGQWGHKWVEQPQPMPVDGSVVLCLTEADNPVGLCRVWPETRRADAPGLVPSYRTVDRNVRLLRGAGAVLGPGPWEVECWGEAPDTIRAYQEHLGFTITHRRAGWELRP
jgi:hypothetical protein